MPYQPWWIRYMAMAAPQAATGSQGEDTLPPPADLTDPFNTPDVPALTPSQGGPGSYPSVIPSPTPGPSPTPFFGTPNQFGPGTNFVPMPISYPSPSPSGTPNDPFGPTNIPVEPGDLPEPVDTQTPSTVATGGGPGPVDPTGAGIATPELFPSGSKIPISLYPGAPTSTVSGPGGGTVPGENLNLRDRVNALLHSAGLPPLPTNFDPFGGIGGLPPGFTETNRFSGGAPIFTPPGFTGPNWSPGGSIFGGPGVPIVPGSGFLNNQPSGNTIGEFGKVFHGIWGGRNPMTEGQWNQLAGWRNSQGSPFAVNAPGGVGGTYRNYLNIWNNLRNAGPSGFVPPSAIEHTGIGIGGAGRPPTHGYQEGGVVGDDTGSDFYSGIGRPVYAAGRKTEDTAGNVFHALGKLGEYLKTTGSTVSDKLEKAYKYTPDGLIEWMMGSGDNPTPLVQPPTTGRYLPRIYDYPASGMRLAGSQWTGKWPINLPEQPAAGRQKINRDLNQKRWDIYNDILDQHIFNAPWNRIDPSPTYMMAAGGGVVGRGLSSRGLRSVGLRSAGMPSMGLRTTDTVPAMLSPGEMVLNDNQQGAVMPIPGREGMLRPDQRAKLAMKMMTSR